MIHIDSFAASSAHVAIKQVSVSWEWYVIRGAGLAAAALLILLMLSGIGQVTGLTYRFVEPIKAWAIHKGLAIAMCVSIAIHGSFLLIDHYIRLSLPQLFIPFLSHYNNGTKLAGLPFGSVAVTFGVLAMYGVAIILASSLGWIDTKKGVWRKLHYLSYVVMILVFFHGLYTGSDIKYGLFRAVWILAGLTVIGAVIARLARAGSLKQK
jgi:predicted ferric reductase